MAGPFDAPPDAAGRAGAVAIDGFQLHEVLGQGAMGVVYRATSPEGRAAAVKLIRNKNMSEDSVRRFEREQRTRVDHPNVVKVLGAGRADDGSPYIAFELLEGQSLDQRIGAGVPLAPEEAVRLCGQALAGLAAAHKQGIIHRDLKPSNLFECKDGTVKVVDFGIALSATDARMTVSGAVVGTPAYLSPEQARGQRHIDEKSDIWGIGMVLYQALCGKLPFDRETLVGTILAVMMEELPPLPATVPPALVAVVQKALSKSAAERWSSAEAFALALREADLRAGATPAPAPPRPGLKQGESRILAVLLAEAVEDAVALQGIITAAGGAFLPLLGERALGLFGAEAWEGDEIERAAGAALAARGVARRMAVASGRAGQSGEGIVAGEAVARAEAALGGAGPGVTTDAAGARHLEAHFALEAVGPVFRVLRASDEVARRAARVERPLLGRKQELDIIHGSFADVIRERRGRAVLITGPAGSGKTRLRQALERMVAEQPGARALTGRASPRRAQTALGLMASALERRAQQGASALGWSSSDAHATVVERRHGVRHLIEESLGARSDECVEFLGQLLGVPMPETPRLAAARKDPQLMADRLRTSLHEYFGGLTERGTVVLILEDLQWADPESLALLEDLARRLSKSPFFLFATGRPELLEERPGFLGEGDVVRIEPRPLAAPEIASLAQQLTGRLLAPALIEAITERSAGNPMFAEQILLELQSQGQLGGERADLPLPVTVEAAVQARLDHLPAPDKALIMRGALFRRAFSADEVLALGDKADAEASVSSRLYGLTRRDFLVRQGQVGRERYAIRTSLAAEVAYRMIPDQQRQELHRRAAELLRHTPGIPPEETAFHHEHGGQPTAAARLYAEAALRAGRHGDPRAVMAYSERAFSMGAPAEQTFALRMARSAAAQFAGRRAEQGAELAAALAAARSDVERARALTEEAVRRSRLGQSAEAHPLAAQAVLAAHAAGDLDALGLALAWDALALAFAGRMAEADSALAELGGLRGRLRPETRAVAAHCIANVAAQRGDLGGRVAAFREAAALYRELGDVRRAAGAEANLADTYNRVGWYGEAAVALGAALDGCRRVSNRLTEGYVLCNLAYSRSMLGQLDEAMQALDEAAALAAALADPRLALVTRVYRVRAQLMRAPELADIAEAGRAAGAAQDLGLPGLRVLALVIAAELRLRRNDPEAALALSTQALALRDELGGVEEDEAEIFLVHAQALTACGRADEARAVRARGRTRIQEVAAAIADADMRTRFLHGVAANRALLTE